MTARSMPRLGLCAALLIGSAGCQSWQPPQVRAREAAELRWKAARADVKARLAADQLEAGFAEDAADQLSAARELDPENESLKLMQARALLARDEGDAAMRLLEQVDDRSPHAGQAAYLRGVIHQQRQQWDEAYQSFADAARLAPDVPEHALALVQVLLQRASPDEALALLSDYDDRFGWTPAFHAAAAECHELRGDWNAAAASWKRAVAGESGDALRERLAHALRRSGQFDAAAQAYRESIESAQARDTDLQRTALAECLLEAGNCADVRAALAPMLSRAEPPGDALRLLAESLACTGEYDAARRVAEQAIYYEPRDPRALELAAALALRLGDTRRAADLAKRCLALAPDSESAATASEILRRSEPDSAPGRAAHADAPTDAPRP